MTQETFSRKLTAILSIDAAGYSRLMGNNDLETVRTLKDCREIITDVIGEYGGRVVDSPGDNLLAEFASVVDAVDGALSLQDKLAEYNRLLPDDRQMAFRIGINLGDVIVDDERIYGDGVNIAARLEGLAEAGGICISGSAYEQVQNKLPFGCEYLGEQTVKNISAPVPAYLIWNDPNAGTCRKRKEKSRNRLKLPLISTAAVLVLIILALLQQGYLDSLFNKEPSTQPASSAIHRAKPSIAVLPFTNLSRNPNQEYFSDGITNDIITDLARFSELYVSASNTVFTFKGKAVNLKEVGEQLGVRYILEGSIQRDGDRVRVNAQLVDVQNGNHLWADRYDRQMKDLFALQDDIIQSIVRALALQISEAEQARALRKDTASLEAYDWALRGWHHFYQHTRSGNRQARDYFNNALKIDPNYAEAHLGLSQVRMWDVNYGWTEFPNKAMQQALDSGVKAVKLDPANAHARAQLGYIYMRKGEYDLAAKELKRAIEINPNDWRSYRYMGAVSLYFGRPDDSLAWYEKAMQIDPRITSGMLMNVGISHYLNGDNSEAVRWLEEATARWPDFLGGHIVLASVYADMDRMDEAHREAEEIRRLAPFFKTVFYGASYRNPAHREKIISGLRKAGLE